MKVDQVMMTQSAAGMAPKRLFFKTDSPANDVKITLLDTNNKPVRVLSVETVTDKYKFEEVGDYSVVFDGKDSEGNTVTPGTYTLQITAQNGTSTIKAYLFEQGKVTGIDYTSDGTLLQVKSQNYDTGDDAYYTTPIPIGSVVSVREHYNG